MAKKKFFDTGLGKAAAIVGGGAAGGLFLLGRNIAKKYKEANTGIKQQISALESQEVAPEITQANQEAQMMKNQGLSSSALGLFKQQADRSQSAAFSQLGGRRSALAGAASIMDAANTAGLKLADLEDEARQRNMMAARSSAMGLGQQKMGLQKYKQEGLFNYYMGRKQALNAQMSNLAKGAMRVGAAVATGGASEAIGGFVKKKGSGD
jgi:hypothetical protein